MLGVRLTLMVGSMLVLLASPAAWAQDDAANTEALRNAVQTSFQQMTSGNMDSVRTENPNALSWEFDMEGNPVAHRGPEAWNASIDQMSQIMQSSGMTMQNEITQLDCHVVGDLGYCTIEWTATGSMGGQQMPPMRLRSTLISRKAGETWSHEHWHSSFAEWPAEMGDEGEEGEAGGTEGEGP